MQVEMRKREQELLAKIKEQQKELDAVKAEKTKVEKELTRSEREREDDRRLMIEKEREIERQRVESEKTETSYRRPYERVLTREKASPAHLRGRRPPSLVSSENDEEVRAVLAAVTPSSSSSSVVIPIIKSSDTTFKPPTTSVQHQVPEPEPLQPTPSRSGLSNKNNDLQRRPSLRKSTKPDPSGPSATLSRSQSFRVKKDSTDTKPRVPQSPFSSRRELTGNGNSRDRKENASPVKLQRTTSWRRKAESSRSNGVEKSTENGKTASKPIGLVII